MKSKWIIAGFLIVALIALCGASVFALRQGVLMGQDNGIQFDLGADVVAAKATETKNLTVNGPADLTVESDFGDITVQSGSDGEVNIVMEKTAWGANDADAQSALKELKVAIEQDGNKITVSIQPAVTVKVGVSHGDNVKFTITVPTETSVTLNSSHADLSLTGTTGNVDLQTDFGAITVDTVSGSHVAATSSHGEIGLNNIDVSGELKVYNEFGDIELRDSSANTAEIKTNNGTITLTTLDVNGMMNVKNDFGDLIMTRATASEYDLITQNGDIRMDGASGKIKAHSDFGQVEVLNAQDATLDLSSQNGDVTFSGSLGVGPHNLTSEFGDISLTLPTETALDADFQTQFGKITSDIDITLVFQGDADKKHVQGKINGGGALLTVKTNNGNIIIQTLN